MTSPTFHMANPQKPTTTSTASTAPPMIHFKTFGMPPDHPPLLRTLRTGSAHIGQLSVKGPIGW